MNKVDYACIICEWNPDDCTFPGRKCYRWEECTVVALERIGKESLDEEYN